LDEAGTSKPDNAWISVGTLDKPEVVEMKFHYGVERQLPWVHFDDNLPRIRCDNDPDMIKALSLAKEEET
jgi:hypothetical protein